MEKVDFKRTLASYRARRGQLDVIEVPRMRYLMVDGHGDPNASAEFSDALEALYPVAYTLKFASRRELDRDYAVPPLEGLWWAEDMSSFTGARDKSQWDWTVMLMVPDWLGRDMVSAAIETVRAKKSPLRVDDVRYDSLDEGLCVQTLHVGSFDDEAAVLEHIHNELIPAQSLRMRGKHHEIYLTDHRRTIPSRQRTILRQPVQHL